jgi:hypothetical protein
MRFVRSDTAIHVGKTAGYALSYSLFTGMLFLILTLTGKIGNWTIFHVIGITASITLLAFLVRKWLS